MKQNTSFTKLKIGILLCCILALTSHTTTNAQNTGPVAPEAMSFEPVDATDMVNLNTGDLAYVLPLLHVPGPGGGYPLALSYHGGIAMDQEASWVGLGWTLNPGAINRGVFGVPDDIKNAESKSIFYDSGERVTTNYISFSNPVGISGASLGASFAWGSHRSLGVNFNASIGIGGKESPFSINGGIGSSGFNLGVGAGVGKLLNGGIGVGASLGIGLSSNGAYAGAGAGLSLGTTTKSNNYLPYTSTGISISLVGGNAMSNTNVRIDNISSWGVNLVFFSFGSRTDLISYYQKSTTNFSGALYPESARKTEVNDQFYRNQHKDYAMDVYSSNHLNIKDKKEDYNELMFPAYDQFHISSQGLGGSFSLKYFDYGILAGDGRVIEYCTERDHLIKKDLTYDYRIGNSEKFSSDIDKYYFYFDNEISSYLEVNASNFYQDVSTTSQEHQPVYLFKANESLNYKMIGNNNPLAYDNNKHRKITGKHIEWITNYDIANNVNLSGRGFIETKSINNRNNETLFPTDGIGTFIITAEDGNTYHYALPVYQFERFRYDLDVEKSIYPREVSYETVDKEPYAYTWFLTAITGPDFIDDGDGKLDDDDLGYWVRFDYGKWTDGYIWRIPYNGYDEYTNTEGKDRKYYSWGRKQIYYLNNITTKTHTAYFVKDIRQDGLGSNENFDRLDIKAGGEKVVKVTDRDSEKVKLDGKYYYYKSGQNLNNISDLWEHCETNISRQFNSDERVYDKLHK
jgi:hypothetical protein